MKIVCILLALCCLLSGCQTGAPSETTAAETQITASDFSFTLPEGYSFGGETASSISILKDDQIVGGIINTGLDASLLDEKEHKSVQKYLESLGPIPLIPEWIIMNGGNFLAVSLAITDPDTDVRTETSRRMFDHDSMIYDLWVDSALVTEDEKSEIFKSVLKGL